MKGILLTIGLIIFLDAFNIFLELFKTCLVAPLPIVLSPIFVAFLVAVFATFLVVDTAA